MDTMNNIDRQYKELCEHILRFGYDKKDRTGTGTKSIFGWQIRHNMKEGFPLLTTKQVSFKQIVSELLWFLRGETNMSSLLEENNNIWVGDAYSNYTKFISNLPFNNIPFSREKFIEKIKTDPLFAKKWGELGPIYGKQWRNWKKSVAKTLYPELQPVDQIANLINDLKTNPDSRRLMVNAWNVGELDQMVLPPCHYGFQVYTRELSLEERFKYWFNTFKPNRDVVDAFDEVLNQEEYMNEISIPSRAISLLWNQRSVDIGLGLPFNIASYALLLQILGYITNMVPEELIGNLGDCHIYNNHIEGITEQLTRIPYNTLPTVKFNPDLLSMINQNWYKNDINTLINQFVTSDFILKDYQFHPTIKLPLSN